MTYAYRFSIIPPGAIIDARVTPRALQVLCLLGRHINDGGWCSRSQVKMARELGCSRSAVQEACEILIETGWVQTRRNGRGGTGPESSEHPFAAFSYRVRIDRDNLPPEVAPTSTDDAQPCTVENPIGGATIAAGGAAQAAGGAAIPAPLEGTPSEGISSEPERDTRARDHEEFAKWLSAFLLRWPTAAADDQARIATAGRALTKPQRKIALEKVPAFLDHLQKLGRKHPPAGWKYLEELRWEKLPSIEPASANTQGFAEGSTQWKIWTAVFKIARPRSGVPSFRVTGQIPHRMMYASRELPEVLIALANHDLVWRTFSEGEQNHGAWRRWLLDLMPPNLMELQTVDGRKSLTVPFAWPPRKDGTISPELSDAEAKDFADTG